MGIDKEESRRIRNDIRQVLLQVWDPIGIQDEPMHKTSTTFMSMGYTDYCFEALQTRR
jgi:hypothetical protein